MSQAAPTVARDADGGAGVRERIRALHAVSGRRIAVLDDDPTGSQSVHGIELVTSIDHDEILAGLGGPGGCGFLLTNTRSMDRERAVALNRDAARLLFSIGEELSVPIEIVSRSDSTLRGHVIAELTTLDAARREATGSGYHAILFAPAFLEAGRFTSGDIHYATVGGTPVPVGESEFARDATFGYRSSDLGEFLVEQSGGVIPAESIVSLGLEEIRQGGGDGVAETLASVPPGAYVIVNATEYGDLEQVALGVAIAEAHGLSFLHRSGPSFVRALAGIEPIPPLDADAITVRPDRGAHGLIVVGSHVGLTNEQLAVVASRSDLVTVELDAHALSDPTGREAAIERCASDITAHLAGADVMVVTSRQLVVGATPDESLSIARSVSAALVAIIVKVRAARPAWVIAKGGITSHDVMVSGLGIRRATVLGQLLPGMVSVFSAVDAPAEVLGTPYVVFAGNVGDAQTLNYVIDVLGGTR